MSVQHALGFATPTAKTTSGTHRDEHYRIIGRMSRNVHRSTQPQHWEFSERRLSHNPMI